MADLTTLARPYAKAAFEVARDSHDLETWSRMLSLAARVASLDTVNASLTSPTLTAHQQAAVLTDVCGEELTPQGRNFIVLLAENRRLGLLQEISAIYEHLRAQQEKTVDVEITTAFAISSATSDRLAGALKARLQREIKLTSRVDSALIGGAVIRAGDTVIDNSIRGKLTKLAEAMNS